jgi:hypothetical protein
MPPTIRLTAALLTLAALAGCDTATGGASGIVAPTESLVEKGFAPSPDLRESLFREDNAVIGNVELERILSAKLTLPDNAKLAAVRFGPLPYWWGWSEDFVRLSQDMDAQFLGTLKGASHVREVAYLPSLVTPQQMTLPYLRQAAARFQADMLLIYRTSSRTYDRQHVFAPDETKAYCTVEAVLLDTRTGIVPFSTVVTENFFAKQSGKDMDFSETVAKAQQQAIAKAWQTTAKQTVDFLNAPH